MERGTNNRESETESSRMKLLGALCFVLGHKWRRLRKLERELGGQPNERLCQRCGASRTVRSRKRP